MPTPHPAEAPRPHALVARLAVAALVLGCAVRVSLALVDPDLWGHVRYGQDWIASGELPRTATHTYTAQGHAWVNHENLAELALAAGFATLGPRGVLIAKTAIGMTILTLAWLAARRRGVGDVVAWSVLYLVATSTEAFTILRPQLLSFLCCAVLLTLLDLAIPLRAGDADRVADAAPIRWRWLLPTPLVMALWANSHGGFAAGLAILGAYLVGSAAERIASHGQRAIGDAVGLAAVGAASAAATLANPYGFGLWTWLAGAIGSFRPEITEWLPAQPGNPVFAPFVTLAIVATLSLTLSLRPVSWTRLVILLLVGWQAAAHLRHIAFFALLCAFWVPPHADSAIARVREYLAARLSPRAPMPWARATAALGLCVAIAISVEGLALRWSALPVDCANYPVAAVEWMANHGVRGRLVATFNWAQYALAALAPRVQLSFDGRLDTCYPQEVMDMNMDFLLGDHWPRNRGAGSGPIDRGRVLTHLAPEYVLVDRRYARAAETVQANAEGPDAQWSLLYQDSLAQVWGRKSVVDDPASDRYMPRADRSVTSRPELGYVDFPAFPPTRRDGVWGAAEAEGVAHRPQADRAGGDG